MGKVVPGIRLKHSRIGEQLELELAGPGRAWREPWEGKSPRVLTRTFKTFSLRALPAGGLPGDEALAAWKTKQEELRMQLLLPF